MEERVEQRVVNISGSVVGSAQTEPVVKQRIVNISGHATGVHVQRMNAVSNYIAEQKAKGVIVTRVEAALALGFKEE